MFSGLITDLGKICKAAHRDNQAEFMIQTSWSDLVIGESIAVDGICLTITHVEGTTFSCDVSHETLQQTTAATWQEGKVLNLERALRLSDRLGGHIVLGHVDVCCELLEMEPVMDCLHCTFAGIADNLMRLICVKGSVTLNGVSLTVNTIMSDGFSVMLIPETLRKTNLGQAAKGDWFNLECDYLARLMARLGEPYAESS